MAKAMAGRREWDSDINTNERHKWVDLGGKKGLQEGKRAAKVRADVALWLPSSLTIPHSPFTQPDSYLATSYA